MSVFLVTWEFERLLGVWNLGFGASGTYLWIGTLPGIWLFELWNLLGIWDLGFTATRGFRDLELPEQ